MHQNADRGNRAGALNKTNYEFARVSLFPLLFFGGEVISRRSILMAAGKHRYAVVEVFSVNRGLVYSNRFILILSTVWRLSFF